MSNNKGKGKEIQKAEDYQLQIPTHNTFLPLVNFPPLPYKTIVSNPPTKLTRHNTYLVRHTGHLFLTNYQTAPSSETPKLLIQKTFGKSHFPCDDPLKTQ